MYRIELLVFKRLLVWGGTGWAYLCSMRLKVGHLFVVWTEVVWFVFFWTDVACFVVGTGVEVACTELSEAWTEIG